MDTVVAAPLNQKAHPTKNKSMMTMKEGYGDNEQKTHTSTHTLVRVVVYNTTILTPETIIMSHVEPTHPHVTTKAHTCYAIHGSGDGRRWKRESGKWV